MKTPNPPAIVTLTILLTIAAVAMVQKARAQGLHPRAADKTEVPATNRVGAAITQQESSPEFVTSLPPGYRDWKLVSVAREEGKLDDLRAILGNNIAVDAYRRGTLLFPEGSIIARIAWSCDASAENNQAFGKVQSFVAGAPKNGVQFMIKDSKRYAKTGGWGYGHFNDGKPAEAAFMQSCFPCHHTFPSRDDVFTRYAP